MTHQQLQQIGQRTVTAFYSVLLCVLLLLLVLVLLATLPVEGGDDWRQPHVHSPGSEPVKANLSHG
jgi:hypothetical protein